jgi:threonine dehydrogenase-like Zn-dependent dehydrogenase
LRLDGFISHRYKFNNLDKAFDLIHGKREKHEKVIVTL